MTKDRGITCYERDEDLCTDMRCATAGCRLAAKESRAPAQGTREQITAQVLLAMSDKVGSDTYGVSYALKINKGRAEKAAESILSLLAVQPPASDLASELRALRNTLGGTGLGREFIAKHPEIFDGAVAPAAPVEADGAFDSDPISRCDLIYRLRNPMWAHSNAPFEGPQLEQEDNLTAMREAADEIERLRVSHCSAGTDRAEG